VDAQNKFQGRSFEIRPTGVAHAELVVPKAWVASGLQYPDAGTEYPDDHVLEHYSYVVTRLLQFDADSKVEKSHDKRVQLHHGKPHHRPLWRSCRQQVQSSRQWDHANDIANHRTGETCTLTFKPRGWRGANAFEIKGTVADASGKAAWDIAGRE
jgi:hypothetical protein